MSSYTAKPATTSTSIEGTADRVGKLVRLLSSSSDGEVLGAARALGRVLKNSKIDFHFLADLIERHWENFSTEKILARRDSFPWQSLARSLLEEGLHWGNRERDFLLFVSASREPLGPRGAKWPNDIAARRAAAA